MRSLTKVYLHCIVLCTLVICSCAAPLLPTPRLSREALSYDTLMTQLHEDYTLLQQVHMDTQERQALIERYNTELLSLLRRVRYDVFNKYKLEDRKEFPPIFDVVHEGMKKPRSLNDVYDDIVPAADVITEDLEEHYLVPGLGVPLVGVIPATKIQDEDNLAHFHTRGTVSTLTAVLEFPAGAERPVLKLIPRHMQEHTTIGKLSYELAGDFSAPIEIYWNLTNIKRGRFLGLLNPQKLRDTTGLACIEQYNPEKIPVILAHGLASSAETFNNLVNRLLSEPEIRRHYQFWYFNYPTGVAWSLSAAEYRKALQEARQHFDPQRKNKHWDQMVVVGHSMGGLITHLNQTFPTEIKPEDLPKGLARSTTLLPELYDFEPVRAAQVVYMATPHRGAPIASNVFVLACMRLVSLPQTLAEEVLTLATLQEDNVIAHPGRVVKWFTSIGQLSPTSADIVALSMRPIRDVPTHSIIGDRGRHDSPKSCDGIVPYWSSHIEWGTETIVPADHSVQDVPETAEALKNVLIAHLARVYKPAHSHSH